MATGGTTVGLNDFTTSSSDSSYRWWEADPLTFYTVDLALDPLDENLTLVAYVPMGESYDDDATFNLNANVAYAASGPGDDLITFPAVPANPDDPLVLPSYTITVVAGPGDDVVDKVVEFGLGNASTITLNAYGGAGNDIINGGRQGDLLHGDSYNTIKFSKSLAQSNSLAVETPDTAVGDDRLFSYRGSDTIFGGGGNDVIDGGPRGYGDTDIVTGGAGADNFLLSYNLDGQSDGSDFWSVWGQNLTDDEVGQVTGSVVQAILAEGAEVAAGFALGALGQVLGAFIESFIDFLIALEASKAPNGGPDVLIVTDFDPSEDVIFVPVAENVTLNNTVEFFENTAETSGWGIVFADDDKNVYAQVMLGADFLNSFGIEQEFSTTSRSLLESVLSRSTVIDAKGGFEQLTSANVLAMLPGGGYTAPSTTPIVPDGTKLAAWGAIGPVVADGSVAGFGEDGSITFGSAYSDALTSNPHFVNPATFTLSDSADAATLINGYAGNDLIFGTTYSDTLTGGGDDDVIYTFLADIEDGELVPETVDAGDGGDAVYTGASGGTFTGGRGDDALIFFYGEQIDPDKSPERAYQVVINLTAPTPIIVDAVPTGNTNVAPDSTTPPFTKALNTYTVDGFETFIGGPLNDWVRGANGMTIGGGFGPDYLDIGAGDMGLTYQTSSAGVTAVLQQGLLTLSGGDATGDVLANLQTGSTYNLSSLTGSPEDDTLAVVAAGTQMHGSGGTDTFGLFFNPNSNVSSVQIPDFSEDDVIDLRHIGATSFAQLEIAAPFAFQYTDSETGQILRAILNFDLLQLTAQNFIFATAASGNASGTRNDDGLVGGDTHDDFRGRAGDDALHGHGGDDVLRGHLGTDFLAGGDGDDALFGGAGSDRIEAGSGADLVGGGQGADFALLGSGADRGRGGAGNDTLYGNRAADTLTGGSGDDDLFGQVGDDLLRGMCGDDRLFGGSGNDRIEAGSGADLVGGGQGADYVLLGAGADRGQGGAGNDRLFGEAGADLLSGGPGADTLDGGAGADRIAGGSGADLFALRFGEIEGDIIVDFDAADGDRIKISASRALTVVEESTGVFSVTGGHLVQTFEAAGATLDDIAVLLI